MSTVSVREDPQLDSYAETNRRAWNYLARVRSSASEPWPQGTVEEYHGWLDEFGWLPWDDLQTVLLLCGAGGQQGPTFASLGKQVTLVDLSEQQLAIDRRIATRRGLEIETIHAGVDDLSALDGRMFDLVYQPVSTCYLPDPRACYAKVARLVKPGGLYLSDHWNPAQIQLSTEQRWDGEGYRVTHPSGGGEPLRIIDPSTAEGPAAMYFAHRLADLLGGICDAGFVIERFAERGAADAEAEPDTTEHLGAYLAPFYEVLARRVATDGVVTDRVATERVATERVATERVATERVATDRVATDRVAPDRVASDEPTGPRPDRPQPAEAALKPARTRVQSGANGSRTRAQPSANGSRGLARSTGVNSRRLRPLAAGALQRTDLAGRWRRNGFVLLRDVLDDQVASALERESLAQQPTASESVWDSYALSDDGSYVSGGMSFHSAQPGRWLGWLHHHPDLRRMLHHLTGSATVQANGNVAYMYYDERSFIDLHTDVPECEATVLTSVHGDVPPLIAYPRLRGSTPQELLAVARRTGGRPGGGVALTVPRGGLLVIDGRRLPHRRAALGAGAAACGIAALCFAESSAERSGRSNEAG